ncbi:MAG TPA: DUF5012 domain-containing protein [Chitinophagaceae bacterium]|nr:DUF5012 domain-containing protein [Chitinophagaceae bacterium]
MKTINISKLLLVLLVTIVSFTGCKKDLQFSKATFLPEIKLKGDEVVLVKFGTDFTDDGVDATVNGKTVPYTTKVVGLYRGGTTVDKNTPDIYQVTYSATNEDGFSASITRTVVVANTGDLVNSIEGLYTSTVGRGGPATPQYTNMEYVLIWKISGNTYGITDALGGYYDIGRAYGPGYAAIGTVITANDISTNSFSFTQANIPMFGNVVDISNFVVDASTHSISFTGTGNFANSIFGINLKQVNF